MASTYPQEVDFLKILINAKDVKGRLAALKDFISFLADPSANVQSIDVTKIVDSILVWIRGNNFKVSQAGLDILLQICDRMSSDFKTMVPVVLNVIIDRLGDSKDVVRDQCRQLISKMIEKKATTPQNVLEKMIPCFTNKNMYIRSEVLDILNSFIDIYGSDNVNAMKFLPFVARLLTDSNFSIRENAAKCLLTTYRHIGDEVKVALLKRDVSGCIPSQKLHEIFKNLEEIKLSNDFLPSAVIFDQYPDLVTTDEIDISDKSKKCQVDVRNDNLKKSVLVKSCVKSLKGRQNLKSALQQHVTSSSCSKDTSTNTFSSVHLQATCKAKKTSTGSKSDSSTSAGAVDEDYFIRAIEGSKKVQISSSREVGSHIMEIKEIVGNASVDWNKRVEALKKLRGLIAAGAENFENFPTQINQLESSIECAVKDLRSQVVREACITISFLAMRLENKFDCFAERILPHIVPLLMSAAKIMSSSGLVCLQLVLRHTHSVRLLPTITNNLSSKSKEIRKAMCKLMFLIINIWPYQILKKCSFVLEDGIKKGIADADSEARDYSRQAYWAFQKHFPEQANIILKNIDPAYHRTLLNGGSSVINSSSDTTVIFSTTRYLQQELNEEASKALSRKNRIFTLPPRSRSTINLHVVQQVKPKDRVGDRPHRKISSETSLLENRIIFPEEGEVSFNTKQKSVGQTRNQVPRKSQQSDSSASMSSRKTICTLLSSGSNFSTADESLFFTSCEDITSRLNIIKQKGTSGNSSPVENRNKINEKTPVLSSKGIPVEEQIFFQSAVETESVLSETLSNSWSGSKQKILKSSYEAKDLKQIILNCGSTHWSDRKEGLVGLKIHLEAGNLLKPLQLRRMTGYFTKMFVDSHTKDFSLFLSTLDLFVVAHKTELNFWLYMLVTRLLNKLGADLLASIHKKIQKSLDKVRESFSNDILMSVVLRYLSDATQTPNSRVKIAACSFIVKLASGMDTELAILLSLTDQFKVSLPSAVTKMVEWTMDCNIKRDRHLMKATQEAIIALFNLDQSKGTLFLSVLPKECQNAVKDLMQLGFNHSSGSISVETGSNCSSSIVSPGFLLGRSTVRTVNGSDLIQKSSSKKSFCSESEAENLNPNVVYPSIWKNTTENQHLGYHLEDKTIHHKDSSGKINLQPLKHLEKEPPVFNEQTDQLCIIGRSLFKTARESDRMIVKDCVSNTTGFNSDTQISLCGIDENETIIKTLESIESYAEGHIPINENCKVSYKEITMLLSQLIQIVSNNKSVTIADHFKSILRIILTQLDSSELTVRSLVLSLLTEMINKNSFLDSFNDYVELLVLKVFKSFKNGNEDVRRNANSCATAITTQLSPELVIRVLIPLISSEDYPVNLCAIKSLTNVIETRCRDAVLNYLTDIMPGLIQAYDSEESSVRKSTVFCMVALHICLGEELLRPYTSCLCGSKLKLLQIYIKRAEEPIVPILSK